MHAIGIVVEWNPYHNGHHLLTAAVRAQHPEAALMAIMSGPFTQRGEPAIFDKWLRTKMALADGIDLVLELPQTFATASLEDFARGAVQTLTATGCLSALAFGSDSADETGLRKTAGLLREPTASFEQQLQQHLKKGMPYGTACQKALSESGYTIGAQRDAANDRLAIHYLRHLPPDFPLLVVPRCGRHNATEAHNPTLASASLIRERLAVGTDINAFIPESSSLLMQDARQKGWQLPAISAFYTPLRQRFAGIGAEGLAQSLSLSDGWPHRLYCAMKEATSWSTFINASQTRHYSRARIQRLLLSLLAPVPVADQTPPAYCRILGASPRGHRLLKAMHHRATVPLLQNLGRDRTQLSSAGQALLAGDLARQNLAACMQTHAPFHDWDRDFHTPPIH